MLKIAVVVGTRPTFIELAPVIHELKRIDDCSLSIYHTGQHYDKEMSEVFLEEFDIPQPKYNLCAGGGTHAQQTARMITRCEAVLLKDSPNLIVVEGDTTSALASAFAAATKNIPIVHIEAGCRIFDKTLPEELNRVMITHVSSLHFPPTSNCKSNLLNEGVAKNCIGHVGHPIVDSINFVKSKTGKVDHLGVCKNEYYYVTLHRNFNVDDPVRLEQTLDELVKVASRRPVIFTVHPRTRKRIRQFGLTRYLRKMQSMKPVDYVTSLSLIKNAYAVISDSGGLTKESALLGTPCITLRPNTEWIETQRGYCNQLAFSKKNTILKCVENLDRNYDATKKGLRSIQNILGKTGVSAKIAQAIANCDPKQLLRK